MPRSALDRSDIPALLRCRSTAAECSLILRYRQDLAALYGREAEQASTGPVQRKLLMLSHMLASALGALAPQPRRRGGGRRPRDATARASIHCDRITVACSGAIGLLRVGDPDNQARVEAMVSTAARASKVLLRRLSPDDG